MAAKASNIYPAHLRAILQALFVTFLWSTSWVLIKVGLDDIPALTFAGLRYTCAFLCLLPILLRAHGFVTLRQLSPSAWKQLFLLGIVYYALTHGAQFVSIAYLPAVTANLILGFTPVVVALLGLFLLFEQPMRIQWLGIGVSMAGLMLYFYPIHLPMGQLIGLSVAVVGMLANAGSAIMGRAINRTRELSPLLITTVSMGIGAIILLISGIALHGIPALSAKSWLIVLWLAVVNTAFAFTLWNHTLRTLSAVESSIINSAMSIQIPILAVLFLGERLSGRQLVGLVVSIVGILVVQLARVWISRVKKMKTETIHQAQIDKPNLIYILADDMGYGDLSCLNENSKIRTVHLDRLAAAGMIFRDAHATSAVCTPSRYSILTGRYNWRSALKQGVTWGYSGPLLEPGRMTVASLLQQHGYRTGCVGKWHLGWEWAKNGPAEDDVDFSQPIGRGPTSVGFDYYFGIAASLDMAPYVYVENDRPTAVPDRMIEARDGKEMWREGPIAPDFAHADVLPTFAQKAIGFIDECAQDDAPFFLYFPLAAPHTPILPSPEFHGKSGTNEYGDFCLQVDDVVGQIVAALERHGLTENTILIFTADNGCSPRVDYDELAAVGHNPSYIFRGHKADIYEGGHRIPLLVRWPQTIAPGHACDETVCLVDLLATCAEILGAPLPDHAGEDSVSHLPLWRGDALVGDCDEQNRIEPLRAATVHSSMDGSLSIRRGHWKLEMCAGSGGWSYPAPGPECEGLPPLQLYNLDADIGERQNVAAAHPEIVEELTDLLTRYIREGRSTPGAPQSNAGGALWEQLWWLVT